MPEQTIRCLLFDLGSTLWERKDQATLRASDHAADINAATALCRVTRSKAIVSMSKDELGKSLRVAVERQISERTRLHPEYEPDFALAALEALRELDVKDADRRVGELVYEALRVRTPDARVFFKDTLPALATLKERGYLLGVVTNRHYGGQPFYEDLQCMGLLDLIDYEHMAISADLGVRKPHPDIFMHALRALHAAPEEAAMVGDSLRADIAGAKSLHIMTLWKPKHSLRLKAASVYRAQFEQKGNAQAIEQNERGLPDMPDEFLLSYTLGRRGEQLPPMLQRYMTPDAIIKDLSDLLALFPGA